MKTNLYGGIGTKQNKESAEEHFKSYRLTSKTKKITGMSETFGYIILRENNN